MRYTTELYDKDNDVYKTLCETDDLDKAKHICNIFGDLIKDEDTILSRICSDGSKEPYDWCQVYDWKKKQQVYCCGGIE